MELLPDEMLEHITSFMIKSDVKQLSLCAKRFFKISQRGIWRKPRFLKVPPEVVEALLLSKPVEVLYVQDFYYIDIDIFNKIKTLKEVHINNAGYVVAEDLEKFQCKVILYSISLQSMTVDKKLVDMIKERSIEVIINHCFCCFVWSMDMLLLFEGVKIKLLDMESLHIKQGDKNKLIRFLIRNQPKKVRMSDRGAFNSPNFVEADFVKLVENNVNLVAVSTDYVTLSTNEVFPYNCLLRAKGLARVYIESEELLNLEQIKKFGFKYISTCTEYGRIIFPADNIHDPLMMLYLEEQDVVRFDQGEIWTRQIICLHLKKPYNIYDWRIFLICTGDLVYNQRAGVVRRSTISLR